MVALVVDPDDLKKENVLRTPNWPSNPAGKLNISEQIIFDYHRSGWSSAVSSLKPLHNSEGVLFNGFLEETFAWHQQQNVDNGIIPYRQPWIGVLHNPPGMPEFAGLSASPGQILSSSFMRESLPYCRGLFVFSEEMKKWLNSRVNVPVCALTHPTETPAKKFSYDAFLSNPDRSIVQIGFWLRHTFSIKHLPVTSMRKVWITSDRYKNYQYSEQQRYGIYDDFGIDVIGEYEKISWLENEDYDKLLTSNIVFLHLYDASANNAVIECIVRETPILVNPLPAVVEHLGPDYPLYFTDLDEAATKAEDMILIRDANKYLQEMDKGRFGLEQFSNSVEHSTIYKNLPQPGSSAIAEIKSTFPLDTIDDLNIVSGGPLDNPYVFVVCFRNAEDKIERSMLSVLNQDRSYDYGVILIDDESNDNGLARAIALLKEHDVPHAAVANRVRHFYTRNLYNAVNLLTLSSESVILELDGDDYLEDTDVLGAVQDVYEQGALRTFGSFRCIGDDDKVFPEDTAGTAAYNMQRPWDLNSCYAWMHLKTFKKSLFERVPLKYFLERNGQHWLRSAEDLSIHPKMVEIASFRSVFINRVLYVFDLNGDQHALKDPENMRYTVENLYRVPTGYYIGECQQSARQAMRLERKKRQDSEDKQLTEKIRTIKPI